MEELLIKTRRFFLCQIVVELTREIDWRARGYGKNMLQRGGIYAAALLRDMVRIPMHHRGGIGQARFRARIAFISETAIPTLQFFQAHFPATDRQRVLAEEALELLQKGVDLISDGRIVVLDEWYATMTEFHELSEYSLMAAKRIEEITAIDSFLNPPG